MKKLLIIPILLFATNCFAFTYTYTFEGGVDGEKANTGNGFSTPNSSDCGNDLTFNDDHVKNGTMAARVYHIENDTGWMTQALIDIDDIDTPEGAEIWTGGWYYFGEASDNPCGLDWSWDNYAGNEDGAGKFFRVHKTNSDPEDANGGYASIYFRYNGEFRLDHEYGERWNVYQTVDPEVVVGSGQWYYIEQYWKFSATSGWCTLWIDGQAVLDEENHWTLATTDGINLLYHWSYWNGGQPQNQYSWMDDIYVSNESRSSVYSDTISTNTKLSNITATNVTFS